jgi:hypothetical protein
MSSIGIYSKDLRSRAVEAVEQGVPRKDVVETVSISLTTLKLMKTTLKVAQTFAGLHT